MNTGLFDRLQGELEAREKTPGLSIADILAMPEPLSGLLNWLIRKREAELADMVAFLGQDQAEVERLLANLLEKGYIRKVVVRGVTRYQVRLAPKRGRDIPLNLWQALDDKVEE